MNTCSITLDIIQITPSTTFYPNILNVAIVYSPGLITLNFPVSVMTGILLIGCFLRHIIQSNLLCFNFSSLKCVVLMRYVIILIKLLCMYVCNVRQCLLAATGTEWVVLYAPYT